MEDISKFKPKIVKHRLILHQSNTVPTHNTQRNKNCTFNFSKYGILMWVIIGDIPIDFNRN